MTLWLAGNRLTTNRLNDHSLDASTTSGLVAGANFTVVSFSGRKVSGITTVTVVCTYTGTTITPTNGNIGDTHMCTLPVGWRPPEALSAIWGGNADGEAVVNTSGTINLRTANGPVAAFGIRLSTMWISENN